jgi:hypothetical protein
LAAVPLVATFRLLLYVIPFRYLTSCFSFFSKHGDSFGLRRGANLAHVAGVVGRAARFVPRATCLTQAVSIRFILLVAGVPSRVCIGVARNESGSLMSHAWVEHESAPVDAAAAGFTSILHF